MFFTVYSMFKYNKITKFVWFNLILSELVFIKLWAASAIIAFFVFILLLIIGTKIKKLSANKLLIGLIVFCVIIFEGLNLPIVNNFVVNVLHKSITFSGRTYLWEHGLNMIKKSPLLGYGGYYVEGRSYLSNFRLYPVHTTYLQILVDGGLILFSQFMYIIIRTFKKLNQYKKNNISQIFLAGLIGIGMSYTFEQSGLYHLMIIIPLILNLDSIVLKESSVVKNEN